jgi:hypothetical protein
MTTRPLRDSDLPVLQRMAEASGFPYVYPRGLKVEAVVVAVDETDQLIGAAMAHRLVEIYVLVDKAKHPAESMAALQALDAAMIRELRVKGYDSAECFLPPSIFKIFGRRLRRSFGWVENWPSLCKHF